MARVTGLGGVFFRAGDREGLVVWYRPPDRRRRLARLDAMLAQLRAAAVTVDERTHQDENGRFGWATGPEGNRIELWQPAPGH